VHVVNFAVRRAASVECRPVPRRYAFFHIFTRLGRLALSCGRGARWRTRRRLSRDGRLRSGCRSLRRNLSLVGAVRASSGENRAAQQNRQLERREFSLAAKANSLWILYPCVALHSPSRFICCPSFFCMIEAE
jgi:hypothetical protein